LSNTHINKDILGVIYNLHDKENDYKKKKDITQPVHFVRELGWEIVHKANSRNVQQNEYRWHQNVGVHSESKPCIDKPTHKIQSLSEQKAYQNLGGDRLPDALKGPLEPNGSASSKVSNRPKFRELFPASNPDTVSPLELLMESNLEKRLS